MGAWDELDTEITVELDLSELDDLIDLSNEDEVFEPLEDYANKLKTGWEDGVERGTEELAKKNVSFQEKWINKNCKNPSGMLATSIDYEEIGEYSYLIGTTINDIYPMSIEYGHTDIYPVKAKALAFYDDSGELIFRKHVNETNPRPFVAPAYEDTNSIATTILMLEIKHGVDNAS